MIDCCIEKETFAVCGREIQKSLKFSSKRLLEYKIEALGVSDYFDVQDTCIKGKNGSLIILTGLQSHTSDSIKSLEGADIIWIEEAQNVSQRSLDIIRPTVSKTRVRNMGIMESLTKDDQSISYYAAIRHQTAS